MTKEFEFEALPGETNLPKANEAPPVERKRRGPKAGSKRGPRKSPAVNELSKESTVIGSPAIPDPFAQLAQAIDCLAGMNPLPRKKAMQILNRLFN